LFGWAKQNFPVGVLHFRGKSYKRKIDMFEIKPRTFVWAKHMWSNLTFRYQRC